MTDVSATDNGLTRDDIAAMRAADWIGFWHRPDGTFYARAVRKRKDNGFDIEDTRQIPLAASTVTDYARPYTGSPDNKHEACEILYQYHHGADGSPVETMTSLLKVGDELRVRWVAANDTENHRKVGLHTDEIRVQVYRRTRKSPAGWSNTARLLYTFLLAYRTSPENSARMVKAA